MIVARSLSLFSLNISIYMINIYVYTYYDCGRSHFWKDSRIVAWVFLGKIWSTLHLRCKSLPLSTGEQVCLILRGSVYSLLHLECHFCKLKTESIIQFSTSLLPRSVAKRPIRLRWEDENEWHSKCNRLYFAFALLFLFLLCFGISLQLWYTCLFHAIRVDESCRVVWMSHVWVVSHMNELCHGSMRFICNFGILACFTSYVWMIRVTYQWVMSRMNESCHIWMSRVIDQWVMSRMNESCHIWMVCVTNKWVMSHVWMSRVTYGRVVSRIRESCHEWTSHVTYERVESCMIESCQIKMSPSQMIHVTYEWVMSRMNESQRNAKAKWEMEKLWPQSLQWVAVCCSLLQFVAMCCSLLQYVAVCCGLMQWKNKTLVTILSPSSLCLCVSFRLIRIWHDFATHSYVIWHRKRKTLAINIDDILAFKDDVIITKNIESLGTVLHVKHAQTSHLNIPPNPNVKCQHPSHTQRPLNRPNSTVLSNSRKSEKYGCAGAKLSTFLFPIGPDWISTILLLFICLQFYIRLQFVSWEKHVRSFSRFDLSTVLGMVCPQFLDFFVRVACASGLCAFTISRG